MLLLATINRSLSYIAIRYKGGGVLHYLHRWLRGYDPAAVTRAGISNIIIKDSGSPTNGTRIFTSGCLCLDTRGWGSMVCVWNTYG